MWQVIEMIKSSRQRILQFFKENTELDYRVFEISQSLGINHKIVRPIINDLIKEGLIVDVRKIGAIHTYQTPEWINNDRQRELNRLK